MAFYPAAPFIYKRGQKRVTMPLEGTKVRISHDGLNTIRFIEGTFVSAADSMLRIVTPSLDTVTVPYERARCLQVYRRSRGVGAAVGLVTGSLAGATAGMVAGLLAVRESPWAAVSGMAIGSVAGMVMGPVVGYNGGAAVWDVAWERTAR